MGSLSDESITRPFYNFCHYRSCHKEQACQQEQQMFFHGRLIFEYLKRFVFASQS